MVEFGVDVAIFFSIYGNITPNMQDSGKNQCDSSFES